LGAWIKSSLEGTYKGIFIRPLGPLPPGLVGQVARHLPLLSFGFGGSGPPLPLLAVNLAAFDSPWLKDPAGSQLYADGPGYVGPRLKAKSVCFAPLPCFSNPCSVPAIWAQVPNLSLWLVADFPPGFSPLFVETSQAQSLRVSFLETALARWRPPRCESSKG
jgi:hypothetical protein